VQTAPVRMEANAAWHKAANPAIYKVWLELKAVMVPVARCNTLAMQICKVRDCFGKLHGHPVRRDGTRWAPPPGTSCFAYRRHSKAAPPSQALLNTTRLVHDLRGYAATQRNTVPFLRSIGFAAADIHASDAGLRNAMHVNSYTGAGAGGAGAGAGATSRRPICAEHLMAYEADGEPGSRPPATPAERAGPGPVLLGWEMALQAWSSLLESVSVPPKTELVLAFLRAEWEMWRDQGHVHGTHGTKSTVKDTKLYNVAEVRAVIEATNDAALVAMLDPYI